MIKVIYNGSDITDQIAIAACVHDMYADSESDTLHICMNDASRLWDKWGIQRGDTIAVEYGAARTGVMYIRNVRPGNGLLSITAYSMPAAATVSNQKAWEQIKLSQLVEEVAGRSGLTVEYYGTTDHLYSYVAQQGISDMAFLQRRCELEGYAVLVYDKKIILYDPAYLERQGAIARIDIGADGEYDYNDNREQQYGSCIVSVGQYKGEYHAPHGGNRVYVPSVTTQIGSNEEAIRAAKGLLRTANRSKSKGVLYTHIHPGLAAGSMVDLNTYGAASWDGPMFLYHVRNDYAAGRSKLFFRRPLGGY